MAAIHFDLSTISWESFVAAGTLILALATYSLARAARQEAKDVAEQVELQREQLAVALHPVVYPVAPYDWLLGRERYLRLDTLLLPLHNGGPGVALNVHGRIWWKVGADGVGFQLQAGSIGPGGQVDGRLSVARADGWAGGEGYVRYSDLGGGGWITRFQFREGMNGQLIIEHDPPEVSPSDEALDRQYPPPEWKVQTTSQH